MTHPYDKYLETMKYAKCTQDGCCYRGLEVCYGHRHVATIQTTKCAMCFIEVWPDSHRHFFVCDNYQCKYRGLRTLAKCDCGGAYKRGRETHEVIKDIIEQSVLYSTGISLKGLERKQKLSGVAY